MFASKKVGMTLILTSILAACSSTPKQPSPNTDAPAAVGSESTELDLEKLAKERAAQGLTAKKDDESKEKNVVAADSSKEPELSNVSAELQALAKPLLNDYQRAVTLMKANQLDDAYTLFEELQTKAPQLAGPALNQALIQIQKQNYKEADVLLQKAIAANGKNPFAYNLQGFVYRQLGQFSKSRAAYEQALSLSPNYAKAHFNLGVLADLYLQDLPLALKHYEAYQGTQTTPDTTVAKWVIDLQKRTGTYKPPAKKAKVEEITVEETPTPAATEAAPTETAPVKTDELKPVDTTTPPVTDNPKPVESTVTEGASQVNSDTATLPKVEAEASKKAENGKEKSKKAKKGKKQAENVTPSTATSGQEAVKSAPIETNAETGVQQP
ncbi:MAG TPA: tetratricopeptide repeat protein [Agitococcus sp.]|nr:tetratricopeptide repeat protein [Agitococcus sp.]